ncbi:Hypothetical protein CAP_6193 [Chondromyces apiculatus DSM 436]|uniref:Hydrolase n=1 Tax=Chondromyces apiculatus DSM 436 TaxID=1192034 RepID=A0A017T1G5_9BACT|nr:Hypothetical protein CAP_6193 [Chondromyces apiculatus DSM 436]
MLAAARRIAPKAAALSAEIEAARRLPRALVRELAEAGLFRMVVPEALGGFEMHPLAVYEVLETLSRADGSTGWCVAIGGLTAMTSAWMLEETAREIFGNPMTIVGGVAAPAGQAEVVQGGYELTGRWSWASGGEHCNWLLAGAVVTENGEPRLVREGVPETRIFVVPREEAVLHDTWHAVGLCGTGSGDMEITRVRVPAARTLSLTARPRVESTLYAFPALGLLGVGLPAIGLGIARRAIDELTALALTKKLMPTGQRLLATRSSVQEAVAESEAALRSARAFVLEAVQAVYEAAERRDVSLRQRAELRLSYTHGMQTAARVVDRMYEAAGGAAVFSAHPLQRCLRDIHVATQHAMAARPTLEPIGAVLLGVEPQTPAL